MTNGLWGELAALGAAFLWAAVAVLFEKIGRRVRPLEMNLLKGSLAILLLSLTLLLTTAGFNWSIPFWALGVLLVSGAVGIGLGDTAYFAALRSIGIRRSLLLGTLAPPTTAVMGLLFLGESLSWMGWAGVLLTTAGVAWVITEQTGHQPEEPRSAHITRGVIFGVLSALCQAGGAILSRLVFLNTEVSPLQSAILRLIAGVGILYLWILFQRESILRWSKEPGARRLWALIITSVVFGTYLAIWLQQISFKLAPTAIAQTLIATSPIFSLPIAWLMGEKLSARAIIGVFIAVAGVALLF